MSDLSLARLKAIGESIGLDAIGATSATAFPEMEARLDAYRSRGLTGYEWAETADRVDPRVWMPEARSLISVAIPYLTTSGRQVARQHPTGGLHGQVSVYAYGADYHDVLRDHLQRLRAALETEVGHPIQAKPAVDTSPLVDRRVAERAGIGWVGKNCMFYAPPYGSFVFLGVLCVDLDIEPAEAEQAPACGTCTHCLDACPTGALLAPGVIDAKRCLSYITQMKGEIPKEFRTALGRRVWGCDTCQWACPENQVTSPAESDAWLPRGELAYPELLHILSLTNRTFQREFGHTAAAWRGLRTWQRNALIALGNCRQPDAVPHLVPFLSHPREELRSSAAWALQQIGTPAAAEAVRDARQLEESPSVRDEMEWVFEAGVPWNELLEVGQRVGRK